MPMLEAEFIRQFVIDSVCLQFDVIKLPPMFIVSSNYCPKVIMADNHLLN